MLHLYMWLKGNKIRSKASWIQHSLSGSDLVPLLSTSTNLHACDRLEKVTPLGHGSYQLAISCGNPSLLFALVVDMSPVRGEDVGAILEKERKGEDKKILRFSRWCWVPGQCHFLPRRG